MALLEEILLGVNFNVSKSQGRLSLSPSSSLFLSLSCFSNTLAGYAVFPMDSLKSLSNAPVKYLISKVGFIMVSPH